MYVSISVCTMCLFLMVDSVGLRSVNLAISVLIT